MTEQETTEAHVPIMISIDVDQLLKSELGWSSVVTRSSIDDYEEDVVAGGNGRIIDLVAFKLAGAIEGEARKAVFAAVKESALARVDALLDETIKERLTLTSSYGERLNDQDDITLREAMIKAMTDRLDGKVDDQGRPFKGDAWHADRGTTYLMWHANKLAKDIMDKELSTRLSEAGRQIRSAATDMIGKQIARVLGSGL